MKVLHQLLFDLKAKTLWRVEFEIRMTVHNLIKKKQQYGKV
jgi:hypothetical protein